MVSLRDARNGCGQHFSVPDRPADRSSREVLPDPLPQGDGYIATPVALLCQADLRCVDHCRHQSGRDRRGYRTAVRNDGKDRLEENAVGNSGIDVLWMILAPPGRPARRSDPLIQTGRPRS